MAPKQSTLVIHFAGASLLSVFALGIFVVQGIIRDEALVRGESRDIDQTVGFLLRSRRDSTRYLIFRRWSADSAVVGARARFRGPVVLSNLAITGDSSRVSWTTGKRYGTRWASGLLVHIRGRITIPAGTTQTADTLDVALPGLQPLALEFGETPVHSLGEYSRLTPGDSTTVRAFTIYPSASAARYASNRWGVLGAVVLVVVGILFGKFILLIRSASR